MLLVVHQLAEHIEALLLSVDSVEQ